MSDVRGIPKRSKTVVFVVLFVFFQVLALAVVGLMALRETEASREQEDLRRIATRGRVELESVRDGAVREIQRQLRDANEVTDWDDLQTLRGTHERPIAREILRVDRNRTVWWVDLDHVLYRQPALVTADWKAALPRTAHTLRLVKAANAPRLGPGERFEAWFEVVNTYPLFLGDPEGARYPWPRAVEYARDMLDDWLVPAARSTGAQRPTRASVRAAVLRSLEVEVLNRVRVGAEIEAIDVRSTLDKIGPAVDRVLRQVPEDLLGDLPHEVRGFRAYQAWIEAETNHEAVEGVLAAGLGELESGSGHWLLQLHGNAELFAITRVGSDRFTVVRLDLAAVGALIQAQVDPAELRPFGLELRVVGPGESFDGDPAERIHRVDIAGAGLRLPSFEAAVFQVAEPMTDPSGQSELVFWGIIAFAVLGFGFGTWVLTRLVVREVRLAQLKADFVGNLSHELKTPLTSIGLFTEMLQEGKLRTPEELEEAYGVLRAEAERLQRIVQRMIDVARKEAQGVAYDLQPADLNAVVREVALRFQRIVTEPGLDLVVSLAPEPLPMMLDVSAMDDVITNLLSNAWKYKQGDSALIRVTTRRRGRKAEVVVSDNGIGIPRAERKRVFEMFYRADQLLTQPVSGTGLGLALVRTIIRGHKGAIQLGVGEGGRGTSFRIRFPINRKAAGMLSAASGLPDNEAVHDTMGAAAQLHEAETAGQTGATS